MGRKRKMTSPIRTSYTLIPKQKYRRSCRLHNKFSNGLDTDFPSLSTLGNFKALPVEIFQMVLEYLPVKDISMLSMVSKTISRHLINYISTPTGKKRLLPQDFHHPEEFCCRKGSCILKHYTSLGLLLKRCTLLLPTKERLRYIHTIFSEISCFKMSGCSDPLHCSGLHCYGLFLQTLTGGWDELECHRVYNFLCELNSLPQKVQTAVSSKPGSARKLELRIRVFYRDVLLNRCAHSSDSAFWLTQILKPWPIVHQARLLYIIFGPTSNLDGHVVWQKMTEGPTDEASLKELAGAIKLLDDLEAKEWTADVVVSLVDELSGSRLPACLLFVDMVQQINGKVVPQEWLPENSVRFLILCGNSICFTFMASKAVNGRVTDLASLMVFLTLVCEKDFYSMYSSVKIMQKVCKIFKTSAEKNNFLQSVENEFAHAITDALHLVISGRRGEDNNSLLNLFYLVNAQANFHKEILYLTMSEKP